MWNYFCIPEKCINQDVYTLQNAERKTLPSLHVYSALIKEKKHPKMKYILRQLSLAVSGCEWVFLRIYFCQSTHMPRWQHSITASSQAPIYIPSKREAKIFRIFSVNPWNTCLFFYISLWSWPANCSMWRDKTLQLTMYL